MVISAHVGRILEWDVLNSKFCSDHHFVTIRLESSVTVDNGYYYKSRFGADRFTYLFRQSAGSLVCVATSIGDTSELVACFENLIEVVKSIVTKTF